MLRLSQLYVCLFFKAMKTFAQGTQNLLSPALAPQHRPSTVPHAGNKEQLIFRELWSKTLIQIPKCGLHVLSPHCSIPILRGNQFVPLVPCPLARADVCGTRVLFLCFGVVGFQDTRALCHLCSALSAQWLPKSCVKEQNSTE